MSVGSEYDSFLVLGERVGKGVLGDTEGVFCFLERGIGGEFIFRVCFIREEG